MNPAQIKTEIAELVEVVRYSDGAKANVAKVNIDENTASAAKYGIRSIPTLLLFKDGQLAQQFVGLQRKEQLLAAIEAQAGA